MRTLRVATRRSPLAQAQTGLVVRALQAVHPELTVEVVTFETTGDRQQGELAQAGGKGLFTLELEEALRAGEVHVAVHSAKDLPARIDPAFVITAGLMRADACDTLVTRDGVGWRDLPAGATVGTGSLRRKVQLETLRPDVTVVPIRGNVQTRLGRVMDRGDMDAVVLAQAGLARLGLAETYAGHLVPFTPAEMLPAAGQGILAIETLVDDKETGRLLAAIADAPTLRALQAERVVVSALDADCRSCLAVYASPVDGGWLVRAMAADSAGFERVYSEIQTPDAVEAGTMAAEELRAQGALRLLSGDGSPGVA